jgi:hypothetical protein
MKSVQEERSIRTAAAKAGMDEKTARKYIWSGKLPSALKKPHTWRTRVDPFSEVWGEVSGLLEDNPGLEAKTIFEDLQRRYPGRYSDGQLRTLQRKIKQWRALAGPCKEVYFPQEHTPGALCQSDFTSMDSLGVTIGGIPFPHLIYHFVLTYSNWETGSICFSESFESLSEGLQHALWELGGVPHSHQTDRLTTAVNKTDNPEEFTQRYKALLHHYGLTGRKTNAASPHENGDIEQRHHRFKKAVDQSLMLRGSGDFESREDYEGFLRTICAQLNAGRRDRYEEERPVLRRLPLSRLDACKRMRVKVNRSSTIRVNHNVYSVHSRLIGECVDVRLYAEHLELWYAQRCVDRLPRLRGEGKHRINYRHIIDWLVRKPGAFAQYRYRSDLFPTHRFRMAYDELQGRLPHRADKEYVRILHLAACESETGVDSALHHLLGHDEAITLESVKALVASETQRPSLPESVSIDVVDLAAYDDLLVAAEVV